MRQTTAFFLVVSGLISVHLRAQPVVRTGDEAEMRLIGSEVESPRGCERHMDIVRRSGFKGFPPQHNGGP